MMFQSLVEAFVTFQSFFEAFAKSLKDLEHQFVAKITNKWNHLTLAVKFEKSCDFKLSKSFQSFKHFYRLSKRCFQVVQCKYQN